MSEDETQPIETTKQITIEEGIIKGTSWPTMKKVIASGINTVGDLARQTPTTLKEQSGVGLDTCEKYINAALDMVNEGVITGEQLWNKIKNYKRLTTGSHAVDEILKRPSLEGFIEEARGGIEEHTTTEVIGENGSGKTQLMHQLAINAQLLIEEGGLNGKVVWIDTENTLRPERIAEICLARGYDPHKILSGIIYEEALHSLHLQSIVAKLPRLCHDYNIKLVIVDSMMAHLRSEYIGRGSLADRQQLLNDILQRLGKIAQAHNLTVIYTNQVMDSPTGYGNPLKAVGGHIMGHASTLRLFIRKGRSGTRIIKVLKSPYMPEREATFRITNRGIEDVEGKEEDAP